MAVDFKKRRDIAPALDREHEEQLARLESFRGLQRGWDSYDAEPPNAMAIDNAKRILRVLWEGDIEVRMRLSPSVEGGVAVVFNGSDKYADLECFNDGEILAITSEGSAEPSVWSVGADAASLRDAVVKIIAFVNG